MHNPGGRLPCFNKVPFLIIPVMYKCENNNKKHKTQAYYKSVGILLLTSSSVYNVHSPVLSGKVYRIKLLSDRGTYSTYGIVTGSYGGSPSIVDYF